MMDNLIRLFLTYLNTEDTDFLQEIRKSLFDDQNELSEEIRNDLKLICLKMVMSIVF